MYFIIFPKYNDSIVTKKEIKNIVDLPETVKIIEDLINEANITLKQVKYIIPHQSNERVSKAIASRLKIPKE